MHVFITVDTEVWPVHEGGWPYRPLPATQNCDREFSAYILGETRQGFFGLPYQLEVLETHGLKATFFVDPLFSFALGLEKLQTVVNLISARHQEIGLHLHPEWLTDPRCRGLPRFGGPFLSKYAAHDQRLLIEIGLHRLEEAGAKNIRAFRAGSWGADIATLRALGDVGIRIDSSLNAAFVHSLPSFAARRQLQDSMQIEGVEELPVTRFADGLSKAGRPLSFVGVSAQEMRFVLNEALKAHRRTAMVVLHSNEFTRTDRLWGGREIVPRRLVARRFESLCAFLARERPRFSTIHVGDHVASTTVGEPMGGLPASPLANTVRRVAEQVISRWY